MTLLEFEHVSKHYGRGSQERVALHDVSLEIDAGELVAVWGRRRSGRSTLLRVAAGLESPDTGAVSFEGRDLTSRPDALLGGIRYCRKSFPPAGGQLVIDQLVTSQLTRGVAPPLAHSRARIALKRAGAERCAVLRPNELGNTEAVRVVIARALVHQPKLLAIDEPTLGVDILDRDRILRLLRSLADDGIAVLTSAGETSCLYLADRALALGKGELHGELTTSELAPVVPLRQAAGWSAGA
jgi:ABC-type multidrug transport system ATPase subunit